MTILKIVLSAIAFLSATAAAQEIEFQLSRVVEEGLHPATKYYSVNSHKGRRFLDFPNVTNVANLQYYGNMYIGSSL